MTHLLELAPTVHAAVASSSGHSSATGLLVVGIAFIAIGSLNLYKPQFGYRMRRWQFKNPDAMAPSAAALTVARVMGAIAIIVGIVLIVIAAAK